MSNPFSDFEDEDFIPPQGGPKFDSEGHLIKATTRRNDPQTSKDAAAEVNASGSAGRRADEIVALLRMYPDGLMGIEIAHKLNVEVAWISSLLTKMERAGRIRHNGKRRNPESGKMQMVWVI